MEDSGGRRCVRKEVREAVEIWRRSCGDMEMALWRRSGKDAEILTPSVGAVCGNDKLSKALVL
ncbi:hypothetical protein LguiA_018318 [Lonicera macranthoides]